MEKLHESLGQYYYSEVMDDVHEVLFQCGLQSCSHCMAKN